MFGRGFESIISPKLTCPRVQPLGLQNRAVEIVLIPELVCENPRRGSWSGFVTRTICTLIIRFKYTYKYT